MPSETWDSPPALFLTVGTAVVVTAVLQEPAPPLQLCGVELLGAPELPLGEALLAAQPELQVG